MSERAFHLLVGLFIIAGLYFDLKFAMYGLIVWLALEALVNQRLTILVSRLRHVNPDDLKANDEHACRFNFEADRALRLLLVLLLMPSYVLFYGQLWIVAWFVGFALIAAGLSNVCPMVLVLRKIGFR